MIETHQANIKRTLPQMMRAAGRLIAVSLATSTAPYGLGTDARKRGEAATERDILRVYATPGRVYKSFGDKRKGDAFIAALQRRNYNQAQALVNAYSSSYRGVPIMPFDGGKAHRAARKRGRVPANQRPLMIVQTTRSLIAYGQTEISHVGQAKGGWAGGATALGGARGLPQWVTRHASGGAYENYTAGNYRVRIENNVEYAQDVLSPSAKQLAIDIGIQRYLKGGGILRAAHGQSPV